MERLCAVLLLALALTGCSGSSSDVVRATAAATVPVQPAATSLAAPAPTRALFQARGGVLPYPTDLYFAGSVDGTLNIQPPAATLRAAVNALDGFSTTAVIRVPFSRPIEPTSFSASSITLLQVNIDNITKVTTGIVRPLVFGVDYTAGLGSESDAGNTILEIRPSHPLLPSTGLTNNGYLVLLTRGIHDASGEAVVADRDYALVQSARSDCSTLAAGSLRGVCSVVSGHLRLGEQVGVSSDQVIVSFSFSTESITDTLRAVSELAVAQPLSLHNTGLTTAQADVRLSGHANLYVGTLLIPYYLSRSAPLSGHWNGRATALDSATRSLTRFNPVPTATEALPIPVLATVPNLNSVSGGTRPPGGWPVLIFEHGLMRSRTDMLAVADSFADSGFVVVAIDLPLHGITDRTSALYASGANPLYAGSLAPTRGAIERTFDLDVSNNLTGAPGADGQIDPSGASFANFTSPLTWRDNLRQATADLLTLTRSLPTMKLTAGPGNDVDPTRIHYLGHSLGAIVGGVYLAMAGERDVSTGTLAMPGGQLAQLWRDSPTLGPRITASLKSQGIQPDTRAAAEFFRDLQSVLDSADPINYLASAAAAHPLHLIQIIGSNVSPPDQVIPNSATQRLIDVAALARIPAPATPGPVLNASGHRAYVNLIVGDHGSLIDPTASLAATTEMQGEAITFTGALLPPVPSLGFHGFAASTPGTPILILNPAIVQQ